MIKNKLLGNYDTKISMRLSGKILKPLVSFFQSAFDKDKLSHSQRWEVIKLIEKKNQDKTFSKNWKPMLLINIELKFFIKF